MQYDLNGKPILRVVECKHLVTQKNADGTTTMWRNGVMYSIPTGDPIEEAAILARQDRVKEADDRIRRSSGRLV